MKKTQFIVVLLLVAAITSAVADQQVCRTSRLYSDFGRPEWNITSQLAELGVPEYDNSGFPFREAWSLCAELLAVRHVPDFGTARSWSGLSAADKGSWKRHIYGGYQLLDALAQAYSRLDSNIDGLRDEFRKAIEEVGRNRELHITYGEKDGVEYVAFRYGDGEWGQWCRLTGYPGPAGPKGEAGPIGPAGPKGDQGPRGLPGPQGFAGPKGDQGPRGSRGSLEFTGDGNPDDFPHGEEPWLEAGLLPYDKYEDARCCNIWQYLPSPCGKGFAWRQVACRKGDQGLPGPKGDQGLPGPKGDQGLRGPEGPTAVTASGVGWQKQPEGQAGVPAITSMHAPSLPDVPTGYSETDPWRALVTATVVAVPERECRKEPDDCGAGEPPVQPGPGDGGGPGNGAVDPGLGQPGGYTPPPAVPPYGDGGNAAPPSAGPPTPPVGGTGPAIPDPGTSPVTPATTPWGGNAAPAQ